jgi:hypothetical protein
VQCIVDTNSVAGVGACFVKEYSVAVHATPLPVDFTWRTDSNTPCVQ